MVNIEEAMLSDIGGHICLPGMSCDLAIGCVYTGSAGIVSIFNKFTWFGDYWNMVLKIFDKHFTVDGPDMYHKSGDHFCMSVPLAPKKPCVWSDPH